MERQRSMTDECFTKYETGGPPILGVKQTISTERTSPWVKGTGKITRINGSKRISINEIDING